MKKLENIGSKIAPIVFVLILLLLWESIINLGGIEKYIMPAPSDVVKTLIKDFDVMLPNILVTLYEGVVGFIIAIIFALILAIIIVIKKI